jgi:acetyl-CoA C-acetyltransferase
MRRNTAVVGTGQVGYQDELPQTYPELIGDAAHRAIDDADLTFGDIDAVVFSQAPEAFFGIAHPERWAVDYAGAANVPSMRIHTGGTTGGSAAQVGAFHVASGRYDTVLVVGGEKVKENQAPQTVLNSIFDPLTERPFGLNTINTVAMQAVRYLEKYDLGREDLARVAVRSRRQGKDNPHAHLSGDLTIDEVLDSPILSYPLGMYDSCPSSSGSCAVVISDEDTVSNRSLNPAWITGMAANSGTYYIGDRMGNGEVDFAEAGYLEAAADRAYEQSGIEDPFESLDVAELYTPFTSFEYPMIEAVDLCGPGEAATIDSEGSFAPDGEVPINPSGGPLCSNPIAVTALIRVAEAADQVRGTARGRQISDVETALATGVGGISQFYTAMVMADSVA